MKKILYCIYDKLAKDIGNVMIFPSDEVAKREIASFIKNVDLGILPDLEIWRICQFDFSDECPEIIVNSSEPSEKTLAIDFIINCKELFTNDEN